MERLTIKRKNKIIYNGDMQIMEINKGSLDDVQGVLEKLYEYENLEEQGLLIKPQCKIGDTVYRVVSGFEPIREEKVLSFEYNGYFVITVTEYGRYLELDKIAFLTKEEAENKLHNNMKL